MKYFDLSAKTDINFNIQKPFLHIARQVLNLPHLDFR